MQLPTPDAKTPFWMILTKEHSRKGKTMGGKKKTNLSKMISGLHELERGEMNSLGFPIHAFSLPVFLQETHKGWDGISFIFTSPALKHKSSTQEIFVEWKNLNLQIIFIHLIFFYWMENENRILFLKEQIKLNQFPASANILY